MSSKSTVRTYSLVEINRVTKYLEAIALSTSGGGSSTVPNDSITNAKLATDVKVGSLASLTTTVKSSLVSAINEVKASVPTVTGTNTGDETTATIKTKLGITTLSGSNTGDETESSILTKIGNGTTIDSSNLPTLTFPDFTESPAGTYTLTNDVITNAKLANVATSTIKGRVTASTGDPEDLSVAQVKTLLSISNVDNTSNATERAATATLSNKRWTPRVGSTTSSATPTINTDNYDIYKLTAQTTDITSFTTNLTGTPVDGDVFEVQITGTAARAITWGASFVASTVALPTTTVTTATLSVVFQYFTTSSYGNNKWVCVNSF